MSSKVLLVDDEIRALELVALQLQSEGFTTVTVKTGEEALAQVASDDFAAVVLDLQLPGISGRDVLHRLAKRQPNLPVVVLTAKEDADEVAGCMQLGALDYVPKPLAEARLVTSVRNACENHRLRRRVSALERELDARGELEALQGEAASLGAARERIARAARNEVPVLILGERGTGKELAARTIHQASDRSERPFVAVRCDSLPSGRAARELFGLVSREGDSQRGLAEQAASGTLYLDQVNALRPDVQVELVRLLQEGCVLPAGGETPQPLDVRVVASAAGGLESALAAGRFREDLYYRLSVLPIVLPPLRERQRDILFLAERFRERFAIKHGKEHVRWFGPQARRALRAYSWPGNVRQLESVLERAMILEDSGAITLGSLADEVVCALETFEQGESPPPQTPGGAESIVPLADLEREAIAQALELTGWNLKESARRLGISRATIYRKIERYNLRSPDSGSRT